MGEWQRARIGDLCQIIKGETGLASSPPGEYPLVATGADRRSCTTWQFDTDAVCIPLVSSTGHGKKTLNYVHYQSGKFALGTILAAVIPKDPSVLTARFLHLYLSHFKDTVLVPLMKGAANVSLPMKEIASVEIPVPPLEEQQNLIDLIFRIEDEHGELLSETNRQGDLIKQLRQAVLREAVEGKQTAEWRKLNPVIMGNPQYDAAALLAQIKAEKERLVKEGKLRKEKPLPPIADADKPFDLPDGWVWCRLSSCFDVRDGTHDTPAYVSEGFPLITSKNLVGGRIDFFSCKYISKRDHDEISKRSAVSPNDILFAMIGSIGNPAIVGYSDGVFSVKNVALFKYHLKEFAVPQYLLYLLQVFQYALQAAAKGALQPFVSLGDLRSYVIPLPPPSEQQAIVARVDSLMAVIDDLEKQVIERKEQAQLLMQTVLREAFDLDSAVQQSVLND